jgi:hypothetical protein
MRHISAASTQWQTWFADTVLCQLQVNPSLTHFIALDPPLLSLDGQPNRRATQQLPLLFH